MGANVICRGCDRAPLRSVFLQISAASSFHKLVAIVAVVAAHVGHTAGDAASAVVALNWDPTRVSTGVLLQFQTGILAHESGVPMILDLIVCAAGKGAGYGGPLVAVNAMLLENQPVLLVGERLLSDMLDFGAQLIAPPA